jgi:hypothetical protein
MKVANFNDDDWISTVFRFDRAGGYLSIEVSAKKKVRIIELQGSRSMLQDFGASMPADFREMKYGEGVEVPEGMRSDLEHYNRTEFRWGCDYPLDAGQKFEIRIPATGPGREKGSINVGYEFPKLLGLLKGKNGHYARLSP